MWLDRERPLTSIEMHLAKAVTLCRAVPDQNVLDWIVCLYLRQLELQDHGVDGGDQNNTSISQFEKTCASRRQANYFPEHQTTPTKSSVTYESQLCEALGVDFFN